MLKVSVIVPCYNAAAYIDAALASIAAQTRQPTEIILVDDGSTDDTLQRAARYPVRIVRTERNAGPAAARNVGAGAAVADVLAFLDADDTWEPGHLRTLVGLLELHPHVDVATSRWRTYGMVDAVSEPWIADEEPTDVLRALLVRNRLAQSATAVRRSAFIAAGGYREEMRFGEDYDLWLRLAVRGPFVLSHAVTMRYFIHDQQVTRSVGAVFRGSWSARAAARNSPAVAGLRPEERDAIDAELRATWLRDLSVAWDKRDGAPVRDVLALHHLVPGSTRPYFWWRLKVFAIRPLWRLAAGAWDRLPDAPKRAVRAFRRGSSPPWQP